MFWEERAFEWPRSVSAPGESAGCITKVSEKDAHATIRAYLEQAGNFVDTARGYTDSERLLGDYFQRNGGREDVFIASKTWQLKAEDARRDLDTTLRLLQSDYVDLYYLHAPPDDPDEMNRVLDICEGFKAEGKIRAIGASVKGPDVTQRTVDLCRQYVRALGLTIPINQ